MICSGCCRFHHSHLHHIPLQTLPSDSHGPSTYCSFSHPRQKKFLLVRANTKMSMWVMCYSVCVWEFWLRWVWKAVSSLVPLWIIVFKGCCRGSERTEGSDWKYNRINLHLKRELPRASPLFMFVCLCAFALHKSSLKYDVYPTWLWMWLQMHYWWSGDGVSVHCWHYGRIFVEASDSIGGKACLLISIENQCKQYPSLLLSF